MYLRYTTRKKDGKVHRTWRLVRSVRIGRRVIQQTVAHLGELDDAGRLRARALARALIGEPAQADLFDDGTREQTIGVRLNGVRIENGRLFGNVYLALALWHACRLDEFAAAHLPVGKEDVPWGNMAAVLVAARLCEPSSELHSAEDWYRRTALSDLLQLQDARVTKDRLYRALDRLLPHKAALEAHLAKLLAQSEQQQFRALHGLVEGLAGDAAGMRVVKAARHEVVEMASPDDAPALVAINVRGDMDEARQQGDDVMLRQTPPDDGVRRLAQHWLLRVGGDVAVDDHQPQVRRVGDHDVRIHRSHLGHRSRQPA